MKGGEQAIPIICQPAHRLGFEGVAACLCVSVDR
jgi:hypothetical protein